MRSRGAEVQEKWRIIALVEELKGSVAEKIRDVLCVMFDRASGRGTATTSYRYVVVKPARAFCPRHKAAPARRNIGGELIILIEDLPMSAVRYPACCRRVASVSVS